MTDLELILDAAREAGELAITLRARGLQIEYKPGDASPVTNADHATDALLTRRLREARPDYGWLSEETADNTARLHQRTIFVVDPIDGTRAFLKDRPWWTVCIAVVQDTRPIAAVVFAPDVAEIYAAQAGAGATLNGVPIAAGHRDTLENCTMVGDEALFRHPAWPTPWPPMQIASRNSTAYRMCLVAGGAADAAVAVNPKQDWDLAAADLIALEAGAHCSDCQGLPFSYNRANPEQAGLVCASPGLAPLILDRTRPIHVRHR